MRYNRKGYSSECEVGAHTRGPWGQIPNRMRFTPRWFLLFSICMIKSSGVSTVNEGFWHEIKGTQSRKQQGRKAAKLLQTTSLEAEGIFIHPANIDFCLCCFFHQCFNLPAPPSPAKTTTSPWPPLARGLSVLGGFIKVAHQSHDVVHSLLTTISSGFCILLYYLITSKGFSIKVKLWGRGGLFSSGLHKSSRVLHIVLYLIIARIKGLVESIWDHLCKTKRSSHRTWSSLLKCGAVQWL